MSKKKHTEAEAIALNGGRPLTQTEKFRHPYTGEFIDDIDKWRDPVTQVWYETIFDPDTKQYQPVPPVPAKGEN